jgi:uncharacterized protein YqhQ
MMKLPRSWAVTVRRANGQMVSRSGVHVPWTERWPILKAPGAALLGVYALHSALVSGLEGDEADDAEEPVPADSNEQVDSPDAGGMKWWELALSIGTALGMFLLLFKALPLGIAIAAEKVWAPLGDPFGESVVNGIALLLIFAAYLGLMSLIPDIKRTFQYHGAEHKVVWMSEKGEEPSVQNAERHPTQHPRCGTSFLFFVIATSVVVWAIAGGVLGHFDIEYGFLGKLGLRLALFPLIVGLSFEIIRLTAKRHERGFWRLLVAPGLWSQRITTKQPDDSMLEVSLRSLALAQAVGDGREAPRD